MKQNQMLFFRSRNRMQLTNFLLQFFKTCSFKSRIGCSVECLGRKPNCFMYNFFSINLYKRSRRSFSNIRLNCDIMLLSDILCYSYIMFMCSGGTFYIYICLLYRAILTNIIGSICLKCLSNWI